jgi:hypothetical protein
MQKQLSLPIMTVTMLRLCKEITQIDNNSEASHNISFDFDKEKISC